MFVRSTFLTVCGMVACTTALHAQSAQRWSLQASGIAVGVFGSAYEGLTSGFGGEFQARVTPSLWSYGIGVQTSSHKLSNAGDQTVSLTGVFFEPRRVFDIGSAKYAPYLSARFSYLQQSADLAAALAHTAPRVPDVALRLEEAAGLQLSASGFQGNIGGGVLTRLTPRVNLDVGVTIGAIRFGDVELTNNGTRAGTFEGSSGTGQNVVGRIGIAIGLGKGPAARTKPTTAPATTRPRR